MLAPERLETTAEVYIPPDAARVVVVSDIDDTVMHTGVANKAAMLWRLFVEDAASRTVFPGVAVLYRALHAGAAGDECNPMLYVSRAPWGIYDILEAFFQHHDIPAGPILFLREWGISWRSPLPRRAVDHKRRLIEAMMALYDDMPFVLIGDSGQHDPEVYRRIVERTAAACAPSTSATSPPAARSARPRSRRWPRRCGRPAAHLVLARRQPRHRRGRRPARPDRARRRWRRSAPASRSACRKSLRLPPAAAKPAQAEAKLT